MTVKRSEFASFLNTGTTAIPVWSLLGDGITAAKINYNPETVSEVYIHQDSGTKEIESYAPDMPIEATCKNGDAVFDFVDNLRQTRAVLDAAKTEILNVWKYMTGGPTAYPAEKQACSIQVEDFGGDGGKSNKINFTINYIGDPVAGTFNATTPAFTAAP